MSRKKLGNAGVTLVEISVVIACIGILAAIALPSLTTMMPRVRLGNATMLLSNEIALMRVRAIAKSVRQRMVFTCPGTDCDDSYLLQKESGANWQTITTNRISGTNLLSVENMMHFSGNDKYLIADTNGTMNIAYGTVGLITLQMPDGLIRKRLVVEPFGRVATERTSDGGLNWVAE